MKIRHRRALLQCRKRRIRRVRAVVRGTAVRPRLAVFRSSKHISGQLINDTAGRTMVAAHSREVGALRGVAMARAVGALLAERARSQGVETAVFDRRSYRYHGQVKALGEAARQGGLRC